MTTRFEHWQEWKEKCAAGLCEPETREALGRFAEARWNCYLNREWRCTTGANSPEKGELSSQDVWHLFETECLTGRRGDGKFYKNWIFDRVGTLTGHPVVVIQKGASLRMRDVVREFLRKEGRMRLPSNKQLQDSLNDQVKESDNLTIGDLLAGTMNTTEDVGYREYIRLADEEANEIYRQLSERERIVLAATGLELPLSNPKIEEIAGRKKSVLSATREKIDLMVTSHIDSKYEGEDLLGKGILQKATIQCLQTLCGESKNSSETWQAELFKLVKTQAS